MAKFIVSGPYQIPLTPVGNSKIVKNLLEGWAATCSLLGPARDSLPGM
jgi:hypothetical protein